MIRHPNVKGLPRKEELASANERMDNLVHLLSSREGSESWALGMRAEIQSCTTHVEVDRDYVGHCLDLFLRSGGWRHLCDAAGTPFHSFYQFCGAALPHGLGLERDDLEWFFRKQDATNRRRERKRDLGHSLAPVKPARL